MSTQTSRRPNGPRGGLKSLISVGALAATALGWILFGRSGAQAADAATPPEETLPAGWTDLLAPLPTLVPAGGGVASQVTAPQPVLRSVSLPAPKVRIVTVTRSSRK